MKTILSPVKVVGLDKIDTAKPLVYAVNHSSALDIPVLYTSLPFHFRIIFKKELLSYPFVGWHLKRSGQICIDQQNPAASIGAIRSGLKTLKAGMPLVIFPEGGRTPDGKLLPFLPGAFFLAIKAGVDVVPITLVGMYELLPMNTYHIKSRPLEMRVGEPIPTSGYTLRTMDQLAARVRAQVDQMRGPLSQNVSPKAFEISPAMKIGTEMSSGVVKIYCDTNTLFHNVARHPTDLKTQIELRALEQLLACYRRGKISMFRSRVNLREIEKTPDVEQLANLRADYEALQQIPKDERFYGTEKLITDPRGGYIENPLVSDVWDEPLCAKLVERGLEIRDAQHITQALCNHCNVFLTCDEKTIIKPHQQWIESSFPTLKVRRPSVMISELLSDCGNLA